MSGDVLFESPFLEALAFSFNNRRKAIGNQSSKAQPGKAYDAMAPIIEALETTIAQQSRGANACEPIWRPLLAGLRLIQR